MNTKVIKFFTGMLILFLWHFFQIGVEHYKDISGNLQYDKVHYWLEPVNTFLHHHEYIANAILIVTSFDVDVIWVGLWFWGVLGKTVRPFIGALFLLLLRELCQFLVSEPVPAGMIWHYPGFPSLVVTYYTTYDFFFSGHAATATYAILELYNRENYNKIFVGIACLLLIIQIISMLSMRFHYTADAITGIFAAFTAFYFSQRVSPAVDRWFDRLSAKKLNV
jgi:hypothetical protein